MKPGLFLLMNATFAILHAAVLAVLFFTGCAGFAQAQSRPIVTEPFEPKPIKIELSKLPPPNEKEDVSKNPKVDAPPEKPVLRAPKGSRSASSRRICKSRAGSR